MHTWLNFTAKTLKREFRDATLANHLNTFKNKCAFKQPNLINYELMQDPKSTYVLPIFIKPGRTHMFVKDYKK